MNRSVLITGGAGFIGLELVRLIWNVFDETRHRQQRANLLKSLMNSPTTSSSSESDLLKSSPPASSTNPDHLTTGITINHLKLVLVDSMSDLPYSSVEKRVHLSDVQRHVQSLVNSSTIIEMELIEMDCNKIHGLKNIIIRHQVDSVIHLAGFGNIPMAEDAGNQVLATRSNTLSVQSCCAALDLAGVSVTHFVFGSSSTVYGKSPVGFSGWTEDLPMRPICHYGVAKQDAEKYDISSAGLRIIHKLRCKCFASSPCMVPGADQTWLQSSSCARFTLVNP